jgi:ribonuclease HI
METKMMTFYIDGGCKGNHLPREEDRTMRAVVCDDAGTALVDLEMKGGTNNIAELWALVECMIIASFAKLTEVQVYTDSTNLIGWVKTTPVHLLDRAEYKNLFKALDNYRKKIQLHITWIGRDDNLAGRFIEANVS